IIATTINFDSLIAYLDFVCPINVDPSKTLSARFQSWLENAYGNEKEIEIRREIEDFTIWITEHHINLIFFAILLVMMVLSIWLDKKLNSKISNRIKVCFIICIVIMWIVTFVAGPFYKQLIYE
ncbi:MAG: hypothetical protein K6F17_06910, partial [Lachnospiraceae bacterium]|nr:hypothetical protein [Lachnospiraceae bacterium]